MNKLYTELIINDGYAVSFWGVKPLDIYKKLLVFFPKINFSWNAFDITLDDSNIELNGFIKIQDSLGDPLTLIKNKKFKKTKLDEIVPNNFTSFFELQSSIKLSKFFI